MSKVSEGPTGLGRAIGSHVEDVVRAALPLVPVSRVARTPRTMGFRRYYREVRRIMRAQPVIFTVAGRRLLAAEPGARIEELRLTTPTVVEPGDMLHLWWRNSADWVTRALDTQTPGEFGYWSTPMPHRPSTYRSAPLATVLRDVVDLSDDTSRLPPWRRPRITPRFYTSAGSCGFDDGTSEVRLFVTSRDRWPDRAASYLQSAGLGEEIAGRVLPHPNRLPTFGEGMAITTGSGAAGVFASLRAGREGTHLLWGLGDKTVAPWMTGEIGEYVQNRPGVTMEIARGRSHLQRIVTEHLDRLEELLRSDNGWVYVSGNSEMGDMVHHTLSERFGGAFLRDTEESMRYIVST